MSPSATPEPEDDSASAVVSHALGPAADTLKSPARSTLRRDIISGYVLTICRIFAWAGVSAIVFRRNTEVAFGILALLRGTITLIGYTSLGIGPAMVRFLADAMIPLPLAKEARPNAAASESDAAADSRQPNPPVVPYAAPGTENDLPPVPLSYAPEVDRDYTPAQQVYGAGAALAIWLGFAACVASIIVGLCTDVILDVRELGAEQAPLAVIAFGFGSAFRIMSEPASAALQVKRRLALDNFILAAGELLWLALVAVIGFPSIVQVAMMWGLAAAAVSVARVCCRYGLARDLYGPVDHSATAVRKRLLWFGATLTIAQVADFLYAPTDYILINRLLRPEDLAAYAPLVQIDGALLLLVSGLAMALFPHASLAHAAGDRRRLRRLYLRATAFSALLLLAASVATWALSPTIFRIWLGDDLPLARAVLPLVLIHTVAGGSSAVGRSILLGMGRVKAFTTSVLVAGVANVILSATFAMMFGLKGIVLGTIVVVLARCAVWMPWYVLKALRKVDVEVE